MKFIVSCIAFLASCVALSAFDNFEEVYPPSCQTFVESATYQGDRRGDFRGDDVAILSDGSAWKIHPDSIADFRSWEVGEKIRVTVRTSWYWFKREHKFALYNYQANQYVKAMIVAHKTDPLYITGTQEYAKSKRPVYYPHTVYYTDEKGETQPDTTYHFSHYEDCDFRKVLWLSDGSQWVIREMLGQFVEGMRVYVGAQGRDKAFYDFILIAGDQREAIWTWARPQM